MNGADHTDALKVHTGERGMAPNGDIVSAARAGSTGAFAQLHAIYSRRLYKKIITITRNHEDAEDALQDTFLRAHLALHAFEGRSNVYTWLMRIAINSALLTLRRRRAHREILFDSQSGTQFEPGGFEFKDSAPNPEQICDLRQRRARVLRAVRKLDPQLRGPIQMQVTQGCSLKEIGRALNLSESAVKIRLHRARKKLSSVRGPKHSEARRQNVITGEREEISKVIEVL
jgi:RNA polymerase sigma-70 factor, ECF subfamily